MKILFHNIWNFCFIIEKNYETGIYSLSIINQDRSNLGIHQISVRPGYPG